MGHIGMVVVLLEIAMKKGITLIGIFALALFSQSFAPQQETMKWEDWNTGYPKGIKEKKVILVDAYTDWCGWCKKMDRDTYTNADVIKKINKYFVAIKFNPELDKTYYIDSNAYTGRELHAMLSKEYSTGYPTTYFIIPGMNRLLVNPGYEGPDQFSATLDRVIKEAGLQ